MSQGIFLLWIKFCYGQIAETELIKQSHGRTNIHKDALTLLRLSLNFSRRQTGSGEQLKLVTGFDTEVVRQRLRISGLKRRQHQL
ncbi:hypothetical protein D5085_04495 [Ectothiorhodospiraceae bacterium BW-2]|nr:hypothetical protein D5085_04495 [Ectothiorhodospiraceae bacterium BW-2]